jgi:hypothetical protein
MRNPFPFVGPAYAARSSNFDAQRSVNLYPEISGSGDSKSTAMLIGTPGLVLWAALSGATVRGMIVFNPSTLVAVVGGSVYRLDRSGISTGIGSVTNGTTPVSMASNGTVIMVGTGKTDGYFINPTAGTTTAITDPDFAGAGNVSYLDGFFVWNVPNTQRFQISQNLGTGIDPLDFASAEGAPDLLVASIVDHREIWLLGDNSTEVFYNAGNTDFPFQRVQGAFIETGCAAPYSVAKMDNSIVWLAKDDRGHGTVVRAQGYAPQIISTRAVEYQIAKYASIDDAVGFSYSQDGHLFYVLSFPTGDATWVYDASTQEWHERAWRNTDGTYRRIRGNCQAEFGGKTLVGDWENGNIYQLDLNTYTDNGTALVRIRQCPHLNQNYFYQFFNRLQVDFETGVGLATGQGSDPQAMLSWSDDGGHNWSSEMISTIGKAGEYKARAVWRRLGKSRDRIFRVSVSDPVKVIMIGAAVDADVGAA